MATARLFIFPSSLHPSSIGDSSRSERRRPVRNQANLAPVSTGRMARKLDFATWSASVLHRVVVGPDCLTCI